MPEAPAKLSVDAPYQPFKVQAPVLEHGKTGGRMVISDLMSVGVQVIASGGETNLHAHANEDATWFVLSGIAKFYGEGDKELATLGKYEGLVIRRGSPYWFESGSPENLVIMRIAAKDPNVEPGRLDMNGTHLPERDTRIKEGASFAA
jgi:mannose-6-phosphate isomerase-like protein (cupin superfamily)